jgi:chitinase
MEVHSITIFANKEEIHNVKIFHNTYPSYGWSFTISIDCVWRYFQTESQVINFINSINQAYDSYRREQGYDK